MNFLWQAGGEVIRRNPKGQWEAAFDTPAGVTALEFYKKLMDDPWRGPPTARPTTASPRTAAPCRLDRAQGKVGMWFQYQSNIIANTADATALNPSLSASRPMPKGPTGITANELNAAMWGISSQIKDPRVRDAAWQFIKFMGSDEADRIRTQPMSRPAWATPSTPSRCKSTATATTPRAPPAPGWKPTRRCSCTATRSRMPRT